MSFFDKYLSKSLEDPEFRKEWKDSELEYRIARNIIQRRKKLGLTQDEIAVRMNTKQSVISRIETGNQNVTISSLKALAKILETDVPSLMKDEEESSTEDMGKYRLVRS